MPTKKTLDNYLVSRGADPSEATRGFVEINGLYYYIVYIPSNTPIPLDFRPIAGQLALVSDTTQHHIRYDAKKRLINAAIRKEVADDPEVQAIIKEVVSEKADIAKELAKERYREYSAKWAAKNRDKLNAYHRKRTATMSAGKDPKRVEAARKAAITRKARSMHQIWPNVFIKRADEPYHQKMVEQIDALINNYEKALAVAFYACQHLTVPHVDVQPTEFIIATLSAVAGVTTEEYERLFDPRLAWEKIKKGEL